MSLEKIYSILENATNININYLNKLADLYDIDKVLFCLKDLYNIEIITEYSTDNDDKQKETIIRDDNEYRKIVKQRFNKCIICQNNECNIECCQVAHILDFSKCNDNKSKYDINNGLLMCANTHSLFDKNLLKFKIIDYNNAMVSIQIDESLNDYNIYKYNGQIITLFNENLVYIDKRYMGA